MPDKLKLDLSERLYEKAVELIPGGSQTNSKRPAGYAPGAFPIYIQRGKGSHVWDVDGNEYIDYISALGPILLGYCYYQVDQAVAKQLNQGMLYGLLHPLEVKAAEAICDMVPCAEMVRFLKGGAEVTTAAARIARAYSGKELILNSGYRGWADQWSAQITTDAGRGVPECLRSTIKSFPYDDLPALEALLQQHKDEVAMVFIDPVSASKPSDGYLPGVRALCDKYGVLLGFDEIVTGFRLAPGGGQEYYNAIPDIACFAKGVANGMPLGVVCGKREVMQIAKDIVISVTYGGECLSLAAVCACIHEYKTKPVHEHLWTQGGKLMDGFAELGRKHGVPFECTGIAVQACPKFGYEDAELNGDVWSLFLQETAKRGVLIRRGGLLFVMFTHTDEDIDHTLNAVDETLAIIAKAVAEGTVNDLLETRDIEESFRRF
ncbi:MAG TPA: aminotransferase class III-fold pyridoxal phosphate-dependent enzyme [Armatimonadota bacterium]|nr:aminotransferase class III-fold pyridoxal phosphate-dependent enzyme [Armatimonadota bacterium]